MTHMDRIYDDVGIAYETDGKSAWCLNCSVKLEVRILDPICCHQRIALLQNFHRCTFCSREWAGP